MALLLLYKTPVHFVMLFLLNSFYIFLPSDISSGTSRDWYYGSLGSRYAYTIELRDKGEKGFLLPKEQIIPSGEEMWAAMEAVLSKLIDEI